MTCLPLILSLKLLLLANEVSSAIHSAAVKTPATLHYECTQYLQPDDNGNCTPYCIALAARFWDDDRDRPSRTISRFYLPDSNDCNYWNRTEKCLQETLGNLPSWKSCQRATCALMCHDDQYGELITEQPSFIPFTELQHRRIVRQCVDILQIAPAARQAILEQGLLAVPEGRCLLRCVMLREDLYNDREGPRLSWLWIQTEGFEDRFYDTAQKCYPMLKLETSEPCLLAARFAAECLPSRIPIVDTVYRALCILGNKQPSCEDPCDD
ncbi:general odorant-binding protein 45-like [Ochlerotatus camptorhynchus]|uniref:general odorant-binding protein 45-like n=1 Tax=Ochlerotatus camptorhynchus TaxID=644619 RepID=UPI0031D5664A